MTLVLGLTGGIATGKSTADAFFKHNGLAIIDADEIAHSIMNQGQPGYRAVVKQFGLNYLNHDNSINRKKLGDLIFNNKAELKHLNEITHPLIKKEMLNQLKAAKKKYKIVVLDVPLLFESQCDYLCDQILVITLPEKIQIERLIKRNNLTRIAAIKRIKSQMPLSEKVAMATYVIANTGTIKELEDKLKKVLLKIQQEV